MSGALQIQTLESNPTLRCVSVDGFSVPANVAVHGNDCKGLKHMCRYVARPPVARERLKILSNGKVYDRFKKPWRGGCRRNPLAADARPSAPEVANAA